MLEIKSGDKKKKSVKDGEN